MRRSHRMLFATALLTLFFAEGCTDPQSLLSMGVDRTLPTIQKVNVLVEKGSVGFEWPPLNNPNIKGINVYRATPAQGEKQTFRKIATVSDRFATHYVDRTVLPSRRYLYTFTTYNLLHESPHGKIVKVQTPAPYKAVAFVKLYLRDSGVVKVLWKPHPNPHIAGYILQRRLTDGDGKWHYLTSVKGRLMPEYIDNSVAKGHRYSYRIIARNSAGVLSLPSEPATIEVK